MSANIYYIIVSMLVSMICGFFIIPQINNYCRRKNLFDMPNSRKMHKNAIPRLGGICFLPSMLIAFMIAIFTYQSITGSGKIELSQWSLTFFISLLLIYGVGFIDDLIGLDAKAKFTVQIIAASLLPLSGLYINNLYGFLGIHEVPMLIGIPLTVFTIVFIDNAINLIDGIDGLAASLTFLSLCGFLFCFYRESLFIYCMLIAGLMGVLIPYLYYNLFGNAEKGQKIFMGDSGSLTLGFILGFLAIKFTMDNPNVKPFHPDSLLLAYTLLIVPVFDVVRLIFFRWRHHRGIFQPDKNHIHHKLMRCGHTQHQALVIILLLALTLSAVNFTMNYLMHIHTTVIVLIDIVFFSGFQLYLDHRLRKVEQ